ncbi:glycoside hydrolase family 31 protein [Butyrivibrio sp. XPD2002]|uniref:glycoside hydrolase family 31 protein n=1 Tax=Butyrivibrio sp. XPD2002 TaxID=1280665 RepID=UPI000404AB44|nr:glycoside hydrolase family 31 protein [Butyrivibrio sp. XPD2002]
MKTFDFNPTCPSENQIQGAGYRISVLTDSLLRLEYEKDGHFTDNATQVVLNRDFPVVKYKILEDSDEKLVFKTAKLKVTYDKKEFTPRGLQIELFDNCKSDSNSEKNNAGNCSNNSIIWNYGENGRNLFGTVRTLDETNGVVLYEKGLFSREGYSWFDDGESCELCGEDIFDRTNPEKDIYFWGYGTSYKDALKDFYHLCGKAPMIPRYALGNWWSKYEKYTEKSYLELMDNFDKENIPITVAVIDMDWHLTEIDSRYGTGWTGYTWNEDYFPDYKRFLAELHRRGKAVTLNLHPADGIRAFETMYGKVATRMGIDPKSEEPVDFDLMNKDFVDAYFEDVMQPYEEDGVDFWWIDWQQGTKAKSGSVDPLWILNHYHYLDQLRRGKRAMIFSRFAGIGSHRYPIGFSGDTCATWTSLDIQPFFTATASNVGYGWWSHDIGGHMHGEEDTERTCRWVQFGVFSPIMRLHSSCNPFFFKEPWNLPEPMRSIVGDFMRLRHSMIPYLYTANYEAYKSDEPLMQPLYYGSPETEAAYHCRNGYYFGSELVVYPITRPLDDELQMAEVQAFIPEGRWIDIFNGNVYEGEMTRKLYRPIEQMPVLIKAGGIVPMDDDNTSDVNELPKKLKIYLGVGADGSYTLFEDDGNSNAYMEDEGVFTTITQKYDAETCKLHVEIAAVEGLINLITKNREYTLVLCGVENIEGTNIAAGIGSYSYDEDRKQAVIKIGQVDRLKGTKLTIDNVVLSGNAREKELFKLLKRCKFSYDMKQRIYDRFMRGELRTEEEVRALDISEKMKDAMLEIIL